MRALRLVLLIGVVAIPLSSCSPSSSTGSTSPQIQESLDVLTSVLQRQYEGVVRNVRQSAEAMPESAYAYRPVPEVRTFGQLIGHITDFLYLLCSDAVEEANPDAREFETLTSKTALVEAVTEASAYCSSVWEQATDEWLMEPIDSIFGESQPRVGILAFNNSHTNEHYGNIVTYMRLNDLVPPSSAPAQ